MPVDGWLITDSRPSLIHCQNTVLVPRTGAASVTNKDRCVSSTIAGEALDEFTTLLELVGIRLVQAANKDVGVYEHFKHRRDPRIRLCLG